MLEQSSGLRNELLRSGADLCRGRVLPIAPGLRAESADVVIYIVNGWQTILRERNTGNVEHPTLTVK